MSWPERPDAHCGVVCVTSIQGFQEDDIGTYAGFYVVPGSQCPEWWPGDSHFRVQFGLK